MINVSSTVGQRFDTSGHHSSSPRPQPTHHCVPFSSQILGQFIDCCHGYKHEDQLQQLHNGLVFACRGFISLLHVWKHLVSVRFLYDTFGSWPCPRPHEAVLGCTARSEKTLEGQERVPEKEPSEIWFTSNQICELVFVRNAGHLKNKDRGTVR